jgi:hypothetical protein
MHTVLLSIFSDFTVKTPSSAFVDIYNQPFKKNVSGRLPEQAVTASGFMAIEGDKQDK